MKMKMSPNPAQRAAPSSGTRGAAKIINRRSWATQLIASIGCLSARSGSILSLSILVACAFVAATSLAETDKEVEARKAALDLAGAFSNDGFKIRDGHWSGMIKPKENALIAVNLYAGNHYWFSVGATEKAKKLTVTVYDESGQQVVTESYNAAEKAAAGFSPINSGQYYVSVGLVEGEESGVCFLYSYK